MLTGVLVVAAIGVWWRWRYMRAVMLSAVRPRALGPDGIVVGGEGFVHERHGAPALLLLHGAGDTPQTLRYLADDLYEHGFHVSAPLLPGHGRSIADFARVNADELIMAARDSYDELRQTHSSLGVVGVSSGGALAVEIASEHPDMPALG